MKRLSLVFLILFIVVVASASTYIKGPALIEAPTITVTAAGTLTLTSASNTVQLFTGSTSHILKLPDATTLPVGRHFRVLNESTSAISVRNSASTILGTATNGAGMIDLYLRDNSTAAGTWSVHTSKMDFANAGTFTGVLRMQSGGTGNDLSATVASGGIAYGDVSTGLLCSAAGSVGQILQSAGASAPTWSTATYPATAGTSGKVLISNGTNIVTSTPTFPNASATAGKYITSDGTNWIASTPTLGNASTTNAILRSADGTNWTQSSWGVDGGLLYGNAGGAVTQNSNLTFNGTSLIVGTSSGSGNLVEVNGSMTNTGAATIANAVGSVATIGAASSTSVHTINGGQKWTTITVTNANRTLDTTTKDLLVLLDTGTTQSSITLPPPTNGRIIMIADKGGNASSKNITVLPNSAETVLGAASFVLKTNYGSIALTSDGTNWTSIGGAFATQLAVAGVSGVVGTLGLSNGGTGFTVTQDSSYELDDYSVACTVAASAMTCNLLDIAGATPTATKVVRIAFRNATAATGTSSTVQVTAALSIVVSSGSTLGCTSAVACTLYLYAINNAGTVVLGIMNGPIQDEGSVYTSTVLAGSGGDDAANTMYSTAAQSSKAIRVLARITQTQSTAGTWASVPTEVSLWPFRDQQPWYINAYLDGANPSLGTADVSTYTEITDAGLTLTPIAGSQPVGVMCSTTNAATAPTTSTSTCAAGSESVGINFAIPTIGAYEVCAQFGWLTNATQAGGAFVGFELIETPTSAQTLTLESGQRVASGCQALAIATGTGNICMMPERVCGVFNWTATGTKGVRLMYEQLTSATLNSSVLEADANSSVGQRNIGWTVKRL